MLSSPTFRVSLLTVAQIPERVVHARGAGVHGVFESYGNWTNITAADFLSEEGKQTPMFTRFSTVIGERGSGDLARDVRGMATRFYTDAGNFDIVGINMPIFFIQDAMQFPDMVCWHHRTFIQLVCVSLTIS